MTDDAPRKPRGPARAVGDIAEDQLRLLVENIPTLCWMADPDGYIFWYNRRWHDYCGSTPEQMEGWGWRSVHDPEKLPKVMSGWTASIASGRPFEMTFPLRGADGVFRPFLTRVQPALDAQGNVQHWIGVNIDVTAQIEAEDRTRETNRRLNAVAAEREATLAQLGEGVIVTDIQGRITFVNDGARPVNQTVLHGSQLDEGLRRGLFPEVAGHLGDILPMHEFGARPADEFLRFVAEELPDRGGGELDKAVRGEAEHHIADVLRYEPEGALALKEPLRLDHLRHVVVHAHHPPLALVVGRQAARLREEVPDDAVRADEAASPTVWLPAPDHPRPIGQRHVGVVRMHELEEVLVGRRFAAAGQAILVEHTLGPADPPRITRQYRPDGEAQAP